MDSPPAVAAARSANSAAASGSIFSDVHVSNDDNAAPAVLGDDAEDSRTSSSTNSPVPADNEESDFFLAANDSQSSLGVPNLQDMQVDDVCFPPVNRLPNEILISIFSKLSLPSDLFHCMQVSKRWARNSVDLLWHRPSCVDWKNHSIICRTLGEPNPFFHYRDFVKRLNLASIAKDVSDGSIQPLAVCTRIERLTLTKCLGLTDQGLIALVENSASLLALDISEDKNITEKSIYAIAQHCRRLQGLNISECDNISNESMIALAQSCKYIKRLKLNGCSQLRDDAILAFAEQCPNILEIDLHQCNQIGNGPVSSLLRNGNCLRELRLANLDLIDDQAFLSLPANQTYEHLRILDLSSCFRLTDAAVSKIIDVAPRLRNLVLQKCRNLTDAAVQAIARLGKNLHYIHLGHCGQITDEGVRRLISSCNRIRYIDLGCCTNLTDESVKRLAQLPKLKRIGLVKCSSITDDSVWALADAAYRPRVRRDASGLYIGGEFYASSLERVHLSYCVNLTLKSIMTLLNSCPRLTHLSLTGVAAFQRDDFQPYCRQAPPDFTPHQRDVFCVFSGHMVSRFREFLNTSPQFQALRDSLPDRLNMGRVRSSRRHFPITSALATGDGEGFDDEMGDEDNDFEGLDASDMAMDQNALAPMNANAQPPANLPPFAQVLSDAPPAPTMPQQPFPAAPPTMQFINPTPEMVEMAGPLNFSSFISNDVATGPPPLSAHGHASVASLASRPSPQQQPGSSNGGPSTASTAPMHQFPEQNGEQQ
ncbi:hypothetical protein S7711_03890 [Stachybotrys chartarum IBT 7711]|uniref:Uncharacterized protein n=1 Tax=Stachybotrys chartarum (strain CBS 109288 / IBT 7711) TaxID=1280523 RepID=A0A084AHW9_STACB|nr:hypothetical protein S7711_03890 [Stachybotrys chartarum IBT 7711]KFA51319.1 hypothetical protein S40293_04375 [Stachybotrys chartarum IBT 40293]KFA76554.1 hypothetical protein S40288_01575 [Stachybotrys chartarum IBT 40288]